MSQKFWTSDNHFFHKLTINPVLMGDRCRPFFSVIEMNETLIENWNSVVMPDDEVYHLGDVSLGKVTLTKEILDRLNGKIYLIKGNHEHSALDKKCIDRFEWVKDYFKLDLMIDGVDTRICMFHYPIAVWDKAHHNAWCLHGHSHGSYTSGVGKILDVGVDGPISNYTPLSLEQITEYMKTRNFVGKDHHLPETERLIKG
jgi:calcineurin-like phosphoesterase family protein